MSLCEQFSQELPQYVADGEPPLARYQSLRAHLRVCAACRGYALRLRIAEDALRAYPPVLPRAEMTAAVMGYICAQDSEADEEWRLLPWEYWVPALAVFLALALALLSTPAQLMPAVRVQELESTFSQWPGAVDNWLVPLRAMMAKESFWVIWSSVFATTAGLGIGLSLANWHALNRERVGRLEERVGEMAAWLRSRTRGAG